MIKSIKFLSLLSILFIIFQSCSSGNSSDKLDNPDNNSLLLRKWYWVSQTRVGQQAYFLTSCSNGNKDYFEFSSPNIANFYHVTSSNDCNYILEPYTWTKNGNIITLKIFGDTEIATISELTATRLVYTLLESNGNSSIYVFSSH